MVSKTKYFFLLLFALAFNNNYLCAQAKYTTDTIGKITIIKDHRIDTLLDRTILANSRKKTVTGYRLQLVASSSRNTVYDAQAKFSGLYNDIKTYSIYQRPYYKLRVGNFKDRLEAQRFLDDIKYIFRGAYIVQEEIDKEEFNK